MGDSRRYVFRSVWRVPADRRDVYNVLADIERYPLWWPEVRGIRGIDERRVATECRSLLPYSLHFVMVRGHEDPDTGVLEALLFGDLEGFARWQLTTVRGGTRCSYDQEVRTHKGWLDVLAPVARPAFRANHWLMMRHGERGLRTYVAGYQTGRR